jgi:peptidoglycan hydrolase FlgJ
MDSITTLSGMALSGIDPRTPSAGQNPQQLRQAAEELEGLFLGLLLKSMRSTVSEGGLFKEGTDSKMYKDMFDQEVGRSLARRGGIGLADMIVRDQVLREASATKEKPDTSQPTPEVP